MDDEIGKALKLVMDLKLKYREIFGEEGCIKNQDKERLLPVLHPKQGRRHLCRSSAKGYNNKGLRKKRI